MSKGDAAHAAQHQHGVQPGVAGTADKPIPKRLAELEDRVAKLEAPTEVTKPKLVPELEAASASEAPKAKKHRKAKKAE